MRDAGFLLHHDYSFDGRPHVDFRRLVGRDRTLWLALEMLGLELQVREVKLVHEVLATCLLRELPPFIGSLSASLPILAQLRTMMMVS